MKPDVTPSPTQAPGRRGVAASLLRLAVAVAAVGALGVACSDADSPATTTTAPVQDPAAAFPPEVDLVGVWVGTWTNADDPADRGTATWTVAADGTVTGEDTDATTGSLWSIAGLVDPDGTLSATSTTVAAADEPAGQSVSLVGQFARDGDTATATLVSGADPAVTYDYEFSLQPQ